MKTKKIIPSKDYDRYILTVMEDGKYTDIDFMQGVDDESFNELDKPNKEPNKLLLEIFNRFQLNKKNVDETFETELDELNHCIELYCSAFIFSDFIK